MLNIWKVWREGIRRGKKGVWGDIIFYVYGVVVYVILCMNGLLFGMCCDLVLHVNMGVANSPCKNKSNSEDM